MYPGEGTSWLDEDDGESVDGPACLTTFEVRGEDVSVSREGGFPTAFGNIDGR